MFQLDVIDKDFTIYLYKEVYRYQLYLDLFGCGPTSLFGMDFKFKISGVYDLRG